ncbi:MAG: hypothetical protein CMM01_08280 [Rhodopirellula sp.]|nr:hypothetical protein [Rhodopirellula sp.]
MELREALQQISDIRQQMARGGVFRGYRSLTVGASGVLGLFAAAVQTRWVEDPENDLARYLLLWVGVAALSALIAGVELVMRAHKSDSGLARNMTRLAVEQFLPCVVVGALLTISIFRTAPLVAWMLPGLWALLFGLGVFASSRLLPSMVCWVGFYYVVCGCICLYGGPGEQFLAPWKMALCFGGGQLLCATILYWTLERQHGS